MKSNTLAGALCALSLIASAAAETPAPKPEAAPAPKAEAAPAPKPQAVPVNEAKADTTLNPHEMICRYEMQLGTIFKRRVCMSREQREARMHNDRRAIESLQRDNGGTPPNMGGG